MATSVKRMVIMFILINLIFGLVIDFAGSTSKVTLSGTSQEYENWTADFQAKYQDTNPDSTTVQLDKSFGDIRFGLGKIFTLFIKGIISPFTGYECETLDCSNDFQNYINQGLRFVIGIINCLIILEIVYLIWSKKFD